MDEVINYINDNKDRYVDELIEFLKIPSVSADSKRKDDMVKTAQWVKKQIDQCCFEATIYETDGHPIVYGEWLEAEGKPTAMVYGHYDVQPPDPLDEWKSPPFEPMIEDGIIYARGTTDDKGQLLCHLKAVEAYMKTKESLPINLKFLFEGEEEIGSTSLNKFIHQEKELLKADVMVISDSSQFAKNVPAITYSLRGIAYDEIFVQGPAHDLHSGVYGGAVGNPANILSKILGQIIDDKGRITIPGFYDDVVALTDFERDQFAKLPFDEEGFKKELNIDEVQGEEGFTTVERKWARPTFDINGMWSGYIGEGAKTVLPARAGAKVSMRLVPDQDPTKIYDAMENYVKSLAPPSVKVTFHRHLGAAAVMVATDSPHVKAATKAIEKGFGITPSLIREGGSIPIVIDFKEVLDLDSLLIGYGLPDDNAHAPNEKLDLEDFQRGVLTSAHLYNEFAEM